jgi:hypothetical protein
MGQRQHLEVAEGKKPWQAPVKLAVRLRTLESVSDWANSAKTDGSEGIAEMEHVENLRLPNLKTKRTALCRIV